MENQKSIDVLNTLIEPIHTVQDIVRDMMQSDLRLFDRDKILQSNGLEILMNDE